MAPLLVADSLCEASGLQRRLCQTPGSRLTETPYSEHRATERAIHRHERSRSSAILLDLAEGLLVCDRAFCRGSRAPLRLHASVFVNRFDYIVLFATILAIPLYGLWRTYNHPNLREYLKGDKTIRWGTIGLSVLATQAGPITFLSMPGQAYESGIGFIQNYFGQPFALIVVCAIFVPIYQRLKVYTAYEYLGQRFDKKTRLLGAFLFLIQRGIAGGITIYAPAIILSALLGWDLNLTIWLAGGFVILYTVVGGTKIVSLTQRYQILVIFIGMALAFGIAVYRLPPDLSFTGALSLAGKMGKLQAVDFSIDPSKRYTFWSGILGGFFLSLSYFGADQSQVQRYLAGGSLRASRIGLLFNALVKVPLQFLILLLGAMVFLFYQFEKPPDVFQSAELPARDRARLRAEVDRASIPIRRSFRKETRGASESASRIPPRHRKHGPRKSRNSTPAPALFATKPKKFSTRPARVPRARTPIMSLLLSSSSICRMEWSACSSP